MSDGTSESKFEGIDEGKYDASAAIAANGSSDGSSVGSDVASDPKFEGIDEGKYDASAVIAANDS